MTQQRILRQMKVEPKNRSMGVVDVGVAFALCQIQSLIHVEEVMVFKFIFISFWYLLVLLAVRDLFSVTTTSLTRRHLFNNDDTHVLRGPHLFSLICLPIPPQPNPTYYSHDDSPEGAKILCPIRLHGWSGEHNYGHIGWARSSVRDRGPRNLEVHLEPWTKEGRGAFSYDNGSLR